MATYLAANTGGPLTEAIDSRFSQLAYTHLLVDGLLNVSLLPGNEAICDELGPYLQT